MISPYLRRPLRSLDEILTRDRDQSASGTGAAKQPEAVASAPARSVERDRVEVRSIVPQGPLKTSISNR